MVCVRVQIKTNEIPSQSDEISVLYRKKNKNRGKNRSKFHITIFRDMVISMKKINHFESHGARFEFESFGAEEKMDIQESEQHIVVDINN